ncbi:MAG: type VI secretion system tube protein Hcp [Nitrospirae bacterium CG_4_10_14_3_um_filter_70_108]|nr:MAG: type VI secretion system tube protein Hcp [Nitrospirae bacterium CG_4_10_14_3_um_filter_70_108]
MPMPAHMTLTGENQGAIKGSCTMAGREDTILVEAFNHQVSMPRDPQTGLASGKRRHEPMSVVKFYDKSSPLLYQALCTGEHFKDVTLKWYRIASTGQEEHYFTTLLEDAILVAIRPFMPNALDKETEQYGHMEECSFTYRRITWTFEDGGVTATDDWSTPR